jgi:hypothetical protein
MPSCQSMVQVTASSVRTRAANSPAVATSATQCLRILAMLLNVQVRIVHPRMVAPRYTKTPWQLKCELFSMAQASLPNFSPPLFCKPSIFIINSCILLLTRLLSKVGMAESQMSPILKRLGLMCVSNAMAHGTANLTGMTSLASSLATQRPTRTSSTLTYPLVLSNLATTPCSTKHGTSNLPNLPRPNCSSTWALKRRPYLLLTTALSTRRPLA